MLMTAVMLAIFATMVAIAWGYPPQSRFLPLVIGVPGIVLTLVQLFQDIRRRRPSGQSKTSTPGSMLQNAQAAISRRLRRKVDLDIAREKLTVAVEKRTDDYASPLPRELVLFAYFFGLVVGVILFGFWLTVPVFLIVFFRLHERRNWVFVLCVTAAVWLMVFLIFDRVLEIVLHTGFVTEYFR